jgi:hypothetical protein
LRRYIKEEGFLEFINQILMTGEVAGLFPKVGQCRLTTG